MRSRGPRLRREYQPALPCLEYVIAAVILICIILLASLGSWPT